MDLQGRLCVRESKSVLPLTGGHNDPQLDIFIFSGIVTGRKSKPPQRTVMFASSHVSVPLHTKPQILIIFRTEENKIMFLCHFQPMLITKAEHRALFLSLTTSYGFKAQLV